MKKKTFISVLRDFGFKRLEDADPSLKSFANQSGDRMAVVYFETWGQWCWIVSKDIPCASTMSYPGGSSFYQPEDLETCLNENYS